MDPLTPTTSTLSPAISHIAEIAASLVASRQQGQESQSARGGSSPGPGPGPGPGLDNKDDPPRPSKKQQQETVRWVLAMPQRLRKLVGAGREEEAAAEWSEVRSLLDKWAGVGGVEEIREECVRIVGTQD